jgi:TRAP-type C4-dicarboxylate transport system permease small subunit
MFTKTLALIVRALDRALLLIASVGLIAMMLHIGVDILSSLLLNAPISVTSAFVTQYYMITVAFLPILAAEYRGGHISVDMVTRALPDGLRNGLEIVVLALTALVYVMLTTQALQQAMSKLSTKAYMVEQTTRIIVWPSYFILPLALGAMAFLLVARLMLRLTGQGELAPPPVIIPQPKAESDHV